MDLFNTGIRPAVDEWLLEESKKVRDYGDYWSASSAGYCMRKNIFERLKVPHVTTDDDARRQRVFTAGHLFHEWLQSITKQAGLSVAQEVELQDEDLMVRGHFDDLVLIKYDENGDTPVRLGAEQRAQHLILYDYKTRNSKGFDYAKKPSYFHKMQLGTYMYMLRQYGDKVEQIQKTHTLNKIPTRPPNIYSGADTPLDTAFKDENFAPRLKTLQEARTLNIEKDTLRMVEVQYLWSEELKEEVLSYWNKLNDHWNKKTIPPCTCHEQAGGFMAKERWNNFYYEGEPCSLKWYKKAKKEGLLNGS